MSWLDWFRGSRKETPRVEEPPTSRPNTAALALVERVEAKIAALSRSV